MDVQVSFRIVSNFRRQDARYCKDVNGGGNVMKNRKLSGAWWTDRVTSYTAVQLVEGSSSMDFVTVPLLIWNSKGFFGESGKPMMRALPSLFVPISKSILRLLNIPYLRVTLILAS